MFKIRMLVLLWASGIAANSIQDIYNITAEKIIESAIIDSTAYKRLAFICDTFGPRLSGSKNLEKTITWILKEMKKDGLTGVEGQRVKVPAWIRGEESITLLKPFKKNMSMLGLGGSVRTNRGGITGEVIVVNDFDDLEGKSKLVKGNIVLFNVPFSNYGKTHHLF